MIRWYWPFIGTCTAFGLGLDGGVLGGFTTALCWLAFIEADRRARRAEAERADVVHTLHDAMRELSQLPPPKTGVRP